MLVAFCSKTSDNGTCVGLRGMIAVQECQSKLSEWGQWFSGFVSSSDEVLYAHDIAEVNLICSLGLNENIDHVYQDCLSLIGEWSQQLVDYTESNFRLFESEPESFEHSKELYRAVAMVHFVQTALLVHYNMEFAEGDYNATDSRNLFLTGVLTGLGGTCVSLPVLYAALGERVGYPVAVASTWEHFYCVWGEGPNSFCFEAAGIGFEKLSHDYYRNFRRPETARNEYANGFLRRLSHRELFAHFADQRSSCLQEQFRFDEALQANVFADRVAPHIQQLSINYALTHYTRQLFHLLGGVSYFGMFEALEAFEKDPTSWLNGPDAHRYRSAAIQNLKRILKNRYSESVISAQSTHDQVFAELFDLKQNI
jgi:hypothetical protein